MIPLIDQVPVLLTVVVTAVVEFVPSLATTEIVSPPVLVPLIDVLLALAMLIGLVTDEIASGLVTVRVKGIASARLDELSVTWASKLIVPEKPAVGVSSTVAVFGSCPGVTVTVTSEGVAVKVESPVTVKVSESASNSLAVI